MTEELLCDSTISNDASAEFTITTTSNKKYQHTTTNKSPIRIKFEGKDEWIYYKNIKECSEVLQVSSGTLYNLLEEGKCKNKVIKSKKNIYNYYIHIAEMQHFPSKIKCEENAIMFIDYKKVVIDILKKYQKLDDKEAENEFFNHLESVVFKTK
jgi:predicted DNA-binding transcriptional regulator AlpA